MTHLFPETQVVEKRRPRPLTIVISGAGVVAVLTLALKFSSWTPPSAFAAPASNSATTEDIRKALIDHQASMLEGARAEQQLLERIEKLLRLMCVQNAKDPVSRDACLR